MQERDEEHFVGLVVQKAVIEKDGKVLLVKNVGNDKWDFPGGRLDVGEFPIDGLAREVREEIGCECEIGEVVYTNQYVHHAAQKSMFLVVYQVTLTGEVKLDEDEVSEYAWIDPSELAESDTFTDYLDILKMVSK